jgi:hypothetical protein
LLSDSVTSAEKERVTLSQEQVQRIKVIENGVAGRITVREAAEYLNLSERQVKRLKRTHRVRIPVGWDCHKVALITQVDSAGVGVNHFQYRIARGYLPY